MKKVLGFILILTTTNLMAQEQFINRSLSLSAGDVSELSIECGAGFLKVEGEEGLSEIIVEAEIILEGIPEDETGDFLERSLELSLEKRGSKAFLKSRFENNGGIFRALTSMNRKQLVNLTVRMPDNLALDIEDGSGSIEATNIGDRVDITDGSGGLILQNVRGDVEIDDGSGSARVEDIEGDLDFTDGSGDLEIENVSGSVEINDGSGGISVRIVGGNLTVDDGSGELRVGKIGGTVRISDGSGSIVVEEVGGDVTIDESGSGSVKITNVDGKVFRENK